MNENIENFLDSELIIKAQSGNQQALELLIQRFLPGVFNLCLRYMQDSFDAEDAAQEAFVKVWKNLKKFDANKSFKNWVLEIAKNTCLDILKKKRVIPFSAFETEDGTNSLTETLASGRFGPFELAEQSSLKNTLQELLKKLSPVYQKVLSLYYEQELNFREISQELDEPLNTVKSRHRRALIMLRKFLTGLDV